MQLRREHDRNVGHVGHINADGLILMGTYMNDLSNVIIHPI